ncbi:transglutaminase-like cysteine peptidase [Microvirga terricola]|uniref:Transglutaminase-like cysteine peptidase n=1 Tax=Microvirga terricola TaxID=2719797 RepID=A0ABX0VB85_9HYPH|nr:transglutaminase-like cysteine peptidase [Microvirga terricola]NIX76601.1 transglutaminase-like cysteine peptidase [Microvirga terricola]
MALIKNFDLSGANARFASKIVKTAFIGLSLVFLGSASQAQTTTGSLPKAGHVIRTAGSAKPIQGWVEFCRDYPGECAVDTSEASTIEMTPEIWKTIVSVNQHVNTTIKPVTDMDHWGVVDKWSLPTDGKGDCEDYQLLKRKLLAEKGLPRRAMRMTVVIDELGEGHAVLMLKTSKGDYVLDNKRNAVLSWERTGYVYVKQESQTSTAWVSLGGVTSPTVTAKNR